MAGEGAGWQKAKNKRAPSKTGGLIELVPPARAVAVIQFGGLPAIDDHARNMGHFIAKSYGAPGGKAKKFELPNGDIEMRRVVTASQNGPLNIISDVKRAATSLKKDKAISKAVVLVLHGNDEGLSRIYRNGYLEDMLTGDQLRSVDLYKMELSRLEKEKAKYQEALTAAKAKHDPEAVEDAEFKVKDTQQLINNWTNDPGNADAATMASALKETAAVLESCFVDAIELQACNVGAIDGVAAFSFAGRLEQLLSTPTHPIKIRAHRRYVTTFKNLTTKQVKVFLGEDPTDPNSEVSETTLPRFVDP